MRHIHRQYKLVLWEMNYLLYGGEKHLTLGDFRHIEEKRMYKRYGEKK